MEIIDIETEVDTCDECGQKMVVFKSAIPRYGRSGLGLCTDCTDSPITIEPPPNADKYSHTIVGVAVHKAPIPTVRKFEITVNTETSVITIVNKKENVKMHKPYLWNAAVVIGWDAFVINHVLYVPVLEGKAIVLNRKILEEV